MTTVTTLGQPPDARSKSQSPARQRRLQPAQALALPFVFTLALVGLALVPSVGQNPSFLRSVLGAGGVLFALEAILLAASLRRRRTFFVEVVLRKQHYL